MENLKGQKKKKTAIACEKSFSYLIIEHTRKVNLVYR